MSQEPTFPADAMSNDRASDSNKPGVGAARMQPTPAALAALRPSNDVALEDLPAAIPGGESEAAGEAIAAAGALKSTLWPAAGVAIGIGSAAIAAALLYRSRRP